MRDRVVPANGQLFRNRAENPQFDTSEHFYYILMFLHNSAVLQLSIDKPYKPPHKLVTLT